jgi:hypothetical protein
MSDNPKCRPPGRQGLSPPSVPKAIKDAVRGTRILQLAIDDIVRAGRAIATAPTFARLRTWRDRWRASREQRMPKEQAAAEVGLAEKAAAQAEHGALAATETPDATEFAGAAGRATQDGTAAATEAPGTAAFTGVAGARRTARKHPVVDPSVAARAHDELRRARRADPLLRPNAAIKHLEHWFKGQGLPCPSETTLRRQIIWKVFGKSRRKRATTDPNEI